MKTKSGLRAATALISILGPALAGAQDNLVARLQRAMVDTALDGSDVKPWHLKLDVQLFDAKGKPAEQGTVEEWWASPHQRAIIYSLPSYSGKLVENSEGVFRSAQAGDPPELVTALINQVTHPMPPAKDVDESTPDLRKESFGKVPLDCIMLSQPIKRVAYAPLGLFPTYCFDAGTDSLRATYDFGSQTVVRNRLGNFQHKSVAVDMSVALGAVNAASAHITTLAVADADPAIFTKSDDMTPAGKVALLSSGLIAGHIASKVPPVYPKSARSNGTTGSVVMHALIGKDGHVRSLRVMSAADPDLAIAALAAVRQWTYTPYLLNGERVEVDTTITVNFNIGY